MIFGFIFLVGTLPRVKLVLDPALRFTSSPVRFVFSEISVYLVACFNTAALFLLDTFLATLALVVTTVLQASVVLLILQESYSAALSRCSLSFFECLVILEIKDTFYSLVT